MHPTEQRSALRTIAMLGNHLPRQCGIATFTSDLTGAIQEEFPGLDSFVLAMNEPGSHHVYPERVRFEIAESDPSSYRRAADFLNVNTVDVVSVQHEYGIFGGKAGAHLLTLLRELRMPIVTTLHTILGDPNQHQRAVMNELTELSERIVVMSAYGAKLLSTTHRVDDRKIDLIPHGILRPPTGGRSKHQLGVEGKSVILTFGLLGPDKGIEYVIDALPAITRRFPEVVYIVLGATHPTIKEHHGETYRLSLEARAARLGVDSNIIFYDRFVTQTELGEFLAAADIYITPYLKPEQITSGTLAFAVGAGKAVISTPYRYAEELLADGRGILVPWRDPESIAREINGLLEDVPKRLAMSERAAIYGREMIWPKVAKSYFQTFSRARQEHSDRRSAVFQAKTLAKRPADLPKTNLEHVMQMTDSTGILQHAIFDVPRYTDGYCLDDNARGLLLMALIEDAGTQEKPVVRALTTRFLAFVSHAFDTQSKRFRNFMAYDRNWTEETGSEDSHGRAVWALGAVVGRSKDPAKQSLGGDLFQAALPSIAEFTSPRAWAFGLLGIDEYLRAFQGDSTVEAVRNTLARSLFDLYRRTSTPDWPWFEDRVTYDNARMAQALVSAGAWLRDAEMQKTGLETLSWLASIQLSDTGQFAPIGSNGFYRRNELKAAFDQQPVEACAMVSACLEAKRATGDPKWTELARRAFGWFLGQNHLQQPVYDASTGGCRDGLHVDRVNENQGAESTLSFQLALLEMRELECAPAVRLVAGAEVR